MSSYSDSLEPADHDSTTIATFQSDITEINPLAGSAHAALYSLLQGCSWQILVLNEAVELVIHCPNRTVRAQIVNQLLDLAILLDTLHGLTTIRVLGSTYPLAATTDQVMQYYRLTQYCDRR